MSARPGQSASPPTRDRLVRAALAIIRTEGRGALTTVRITQEAGIAQPRFYRYFDSLEQCVETVALTLVAQRADVSAALQRRLRRLDDPEELAPYYEAVFEQSLKDRPFFETIGRCRGDQSTLGNLVRAADERSLTESIDETRARLAAGGASPGQIGAVPLVMALAAVATRSAVTLVLGDPAVNRRELARELAEFVIGGSDRIYARHREKPTDP